MGDTPDEALVTKRFMFVNRRPPHGTIYAQEVLQMVLISAMFDQDVHLAFLDDGVLQLRLGQTPSVLDMKDFWRTYRALDGYGIDRIYAERELLQERGFSAEDLVIPVDVVGRADMARLMDEMDVVLTA